MEKLKNIKLKKAEVLKNLRRRYDDLKTVVEAQLKQMGDHIDDIASEIAQELGKHELRCLEQIKANNQKQLCLQSATVLWERERPVLERIVNICSDLS